MNSSGIKRGLATTAVAALAVTGVPFIATSAHAVPLNSQVTDVNTVELVAPSVATVSAQNDGQNTTVRLEAIGGANVSSVRFSYSLNGTDFNTVQTVQRNDNGAFSAEWAPAGLAGATGVTLRAVGLGADGTTVVDTVDSTIAIDNNAATVNVNDGTGVGVFQATYTGATAQNVIVRGTASAPAATPAVDFWDGTGFSGTPVTATNTTATGATTGTWTAVLDITGYTYGATDELLVNATATTDDAEAFSLYKQTITTVTAVADKTQVQAGNTAKVTVTVLDQNQQPIAGAEVRSSRGGMPAYTNAQGKAEFAQTAGSSYYYANVDDSDAYEPELGDKQSDVITVTQYAPAETSLKATSRDGAAFDLDEFAYDGTVAGSDIRLQVTDQNGNPVTEAGRTVRYYWQVTAFDGNPAGAQRYPAASATPNYVEATTLTGGIAVIDLPTVTDAEGTYELFAGLQPNVLGNGGIASSKVLEVKAGDANIVFDESEPEIAAAGDQEEVSGKLVLDDGTALGGRSVQVTYANGGGNANIVQANGTLAASRTVTTAADGSFSVVVDDPAATPQTTESGTITAQTVAGTVDSDNPGATSAAQDVVFAQSATPAGAKVVISAITDGAGNQGTPGVAEVGTVTVTDASAAPIANQLVTLTVDGDTFFTDGTPAATPTNGADAGDLKSLGKEITVVTNGSGVANFQVAVARSEDFDDDGLAEDIVTATAGAATDTEDVDYSSANPLNGGQVRIEFSPASEQDAGNNLPQARPGTDVEFDVFTEDQFGNLVGGELVTVADNTTDAEVEGVDADTTAAGLQIESDFDNNGDFSATADEVEDQTITGTWTTSTERYIGTPPVLTSGTETLTDSIEVNWADVEIDREATTMTSSVTSEPVAVGTAVTETVTVVDVDGNPVPGVMVEFTQAGPGAATNSQTRFTNAQGQAFYTFIGAAEGDAFITAEVDTNAEPIVLSDTVSFGVAGPFDVTASLRGKNNGAKADRLKVVTETDHASITAEGATVKLFKVVNKKARLVATKTINADEKAFFKVADRNGKKQTTYFVKVQKTEDTKFAKSNLRRIR